MAQEVLTAVPTELRVGMKLAFTISFDDWIPSEGTVTLAFQPKDGSAGGFQIVASDNLDDTFLVELDDSATLGKTAGSWTWTAKIAAGGDDYFLTSGAVTFLANPFAGAVDERTHWEKVRDAIRLSLSSDDQSHVSSYSVDNLSLAKATKDELFEALAFCDEQIQFEENKLAADRGEAIPHSSTIRLELD